MTRNIGKTALLCLVLSLALAGCGTFGDDQSEDPDYQTGYSAGCGTGTGYIPGNSSTVIRDPDMWRTSKAYRAGWKKGFNACRTSTAASPSAGSEYGRGRSNGPSGY